MEDVGYMNIFSGYPRSVFQDFESYLRTEIDLVENDIRLVLDKYNSIFFTILKIFPKLFLTFSNMNVQNLAPKKLLNLMTLPGKINWLLTVV